MKGGYPHYCFYCGRGLSEKWRITAEERLILAIFGYGICCKGCAKERLDAIKSR